jgi:hypothetical protein
MDGFRYCRALSDRVYIGSYEGVGYFKHSINHTKCALSLRTTLKAKRFESRDDFLLRFF